MESRYILVIVAAANKAEAEKIAHVLLEEKLIACANIIGPAHSLYWWQGKIENTEEHIILMKTRKSLFNKISETIKAVHSYQIPEIIAIPITEGFKPYIKWLDENMT